MPEIGASKNTFKTGIASMKEAFADWFGRDPIGDPNGKLLPTTPIPEAYWIVYDKYILPLIALTNRRDEINPDGDGPLWTESADLRKAWATAKNRFRSALTPIFQPWSLAGMPYHEWGKGPKMTHEQAITFWDECKRLEMAINQVYDADPDAVTTWEVYKQTAADTANELARKAKEIAKKGLEIGGGLVAAVALLAIVFLMKD